MDFSESVKFAEELDREGLGRFAVNYDLLALANAVIEMDDEYNRGVKINHALFKTMRGYLVEAATQYNVESDRYFGELLHWRLRNGMDSINKVFWLPSVIEWCNHIPAIIEHVALHDYFDHNIWDLDTAYKLLADDVDPAIYNSVVDA